MEGLGGVAFVFACSEFSRVTALVATEHDITVWGGVATIFGLPFEFPARGGGDRLELGP